MACIDYVGSHGSEAEDHIGTLEDVNTSIPSTHRPHNHSITGSSISLSSVSSSVTSTGTSVGTRDYEITGEVQLCLGYTDGKLSIRVDSATGLTPIKRGQSLSPYVKIYLLPDKTKETKQKTSVKHKTTNPVYKETLTYTVVASQLSRYTLWVSVWHHRMMGRNWFLGEIRLPLSSLDLTEPVSTTQPLQDKDDTSNPQWGELEIGLKFVPGGEIQSKSGTQTRGTLYVKVKQARELPMMDSRTLTNATVKCYLLPDSRSRDKRKTPVKQGTSNPVWEEEFAYETTQEGLKEEHVLEITVKDHCFRKVVGGLRLGLHKKKHRWMDSTEDEATHWQEMLANPGKWVERWHVLRPSMKLLKTRSLCSVSLDSPVPVPKSFKLDTRTSEDVVPDDQLVPLQVVTSVPTESLTICRRPGVNLDQVDWKTILTEADLHSVFEKVVGLAHRWKFLGSALGVRAEDIKAIEKSYRSDVQECLREVLCCWLQQKCTRTSDAPTWGSLVRAVQNDAGGGHPALAERIAAEHLFATSPVAPTSSPLLKRSHTSQHQAPEESKVIVVGDKSVGKSSLVRTYCQGESEVRSQMTLQPDVLSAEVEVSSGKIVLLKIWDTAGTEHFQSLTQQLYRNADGVVFVFDVANQKSFERIETYWMQEIRQRCPLAALLLVGNKSDLQNTEKMDLTGARRFAGEHNMKFFETSAKENTNVEEAFQELAEGIHNLRLQMSNSWEKVEIVHLSPCPSPSRRSRGCKC